MIKSLLLPNPSAYAREREWVRGRVRERGKKKVREQESGKKGKECNVYKKRRERKKD